MSDSVVAYKKDIVKKSFAEHGVLVIFVYERNVVPLLNSCCDDLYKQYV